MKITEQQLKDIIKEELKKELLNESKLKDDLILRLKDLNMLFYGNNGISTLLFNEVNDRLKKGDDSANNLNSNRKFIEGEFDTFFENLQKTINTHIN